MTHRLAALWLRIELTRRWRPLLILMLLVALSAGMVLTAVAGARRGATALDRLEDRTLPATAMVRANYIGPAGQPGFDWDAVRRLENVEAVSTYPGYSGFGIDEAPADTVGVYLPLDDQAMHTVERPVVLAGRLADPARADESVITEGFEDSYGLGLGDTVTLRLFSGEQVDTGVSAVHTAFNPRPSGDAVRSRIVGVVRSPWFSDEVGRRGRLIPSAGLAAAHPAAVLGARSDGEQWAMVRLRHGDADLPRFRSQLVALPNGGGSDLTPRSQTAEHLRDVSRFEALCLLALAGAVLLVAAFLIGQAIARHVSSAVEDLAVLAALGLTRRQAVTLAATGPALAGAAGAVLGVIVAVAASQWLPFGVAATLEPAPGISADLLVLGPGALLWALAVTGWAAVATRLALRLRHRPVVRASSIARAAASTGVPVPVVIGARYALEPGRGGRSIPVRSALIGSVAGVLGIAAAATFAVAVDDARRSPERFGQVHQLVVALGYLSSENGAPTQQELAILRADPDVTSVFDTRFQSAQLPGAAEGGVIAGSARTLTVFQYQPPAGAGAPGVLDPMVLLSGRAPFGPNEVVLAPSTADLLRATVGSAVTLQGRVGAPRSDTKPAAPPRSTRITPVVTGIGFVPQTDYNEYDSGAWLSGAGYERMFGGEYLNRDALVSLRPGADPEAAAARYLAAASPLPGAQPVFVDTAAQPRRSIEIRDLRVLPLLLGGFLALLALAATAHVLSVSASRRRHELAVLRAVGMTRRQARLVTVTQAVVYAATGLLLGIPLGIALGRTLWRAVAHSTPLAYEPPMPVAVLLLTIPLTLLAVQLLAAPAGRRTARMRIADALRAE